MQIKTVMASVLEIPVDDIDEKTTSETVDNWDSLMHDVVDKVQSHLSKIENL